MECSKKCTWNIYKHKCTLSFANLCFEVCICKFSFVDLYILFSACKLCFASLCIQTHACKLTFKSKNIYTCECAHTLLTSLLCGNVLYTEGCKRNRLAVRERGWDLQLLTNQCLWNRYAQHSWLVNTVSQPWSHSGTGHWEHREFSRWAYCELEPMQLNIYIFLSTNLSMINNHLYSNEFNISKVCCSTLIFFGT